MADSAPSKILTAIANAGRTFTFPGKWRVIQCDKAFFQLPPDTAALLADLRQQFGDEALLGAGVVEVDSAGELSLHPLLTQTASPIWAIHHNASGKVFGLVAQMQLIGAATHPLLAAMKVPTLQTRLKVQEPRIIVAYDMVSLAIWWSLGFAAIPGTDWSQCQPGELRPIMNVLEMSLDVVEAETQSDPPSPTPFQLGLFKTRPALQRQMILANWRLDCLSREVTPSANHSWMFLQELSAQFPGAVRHVRLWKPSESLLQQLKLLFRIGKPDRITACLETCLKQDAQAIPSNDADASSSADELQRAVRDWQNSVHVASTPEGPRKAFAHLMATYERLQFSPLINAAADTDDIVERNLLLSLVEAKRMLLPLMLHTSHSVLQQIRDSSSRSVGAFASDPFKQVISLLDRELKIIKEIQACRQRKQLPTEALPEEPIASSLLPTWAYPRRNCSR